MGSACSCFGPGPQAQLFAAAASGDAYMVSELLASGGPGAKGRKGGGRAAASVTAADEHGFTALHLAAEHGHAKIVTELIARHADLNARTASGFTALALAARSGDDECVLALLNEGAEVQHTDLAYGAFGLRRHARVCAQSRASAPCSGGKSIAATRAPAQAQAFAQGARAGATGSPTRCCQRLLVRLRLRLRYAYATPTPMLTPPARLAPHAHPPLPPRSHLTRLDGVDVGH